jgi:23S rRNA pseudouridine1911/1915/1917 synthase
MAKPKKFTITPEQNNTRLDIFVTEQLGISRSLAQKMIADKLILVNDKLPKKAGDQLKTGHIVLISKGDATTVTAKMAVKRRGSTILPIPRGAKDTLPPPAEPKVIAETKDYIVIEKPSGLLSHPTMAGEKYSVAGWAAKKYPGIKKVGDDPKVRPGIVHRLDKEASGLMVIARTQKMFNHLKEQFKNHTIEKDYYALVHDPVERDWAELNFPLARSGRSDRMAARPIKTSQSETSDDEKEAKTEFQAERHFVNFSLLRVTTHTGRMHQIRVHFLAYNHPLVGDPLYYQKKRKHAMDNKLGRLFLHATKLSFTDLAGNRETFESPLPTELSKFLEILP